MLSAHARSEAHLHGDQAASGSYVRSAAHVKDLARDVARLVGSEVERRFGNFLRLTDTAYRDAAAKVGESLFGEVGKDRGVDQPGSDRVRGDSRGRELDRERLDEAVRARLGGADMRQFGIS